MHRVHDLVGDPAQHVAVVAGLGVPLKSIGLPIRIPGRRIVGILKNRDGTNWVSIMPTGITGTPACSTSRATPVLPL